jgi:hypothetical protein
MKTTYCKRVFGGTLLAFSMLFGMVLSTSVTAQAQGSMYAQHDRDQDRNEGQRDRNWRRRGNDGYPNLGGSPQLRQTALNAGYNEGSKKGRDDYSHRRRSDFRDDGTYRKATKDYSSRLGDREIYRRYFQLAYETGYSDGREGH